MGRHLTFVPTYAGILESGHFYAHGCFVGKGLLVPMSYSVTFAHTQEKSDFSAVNVGRDSCVVTI